jgi:hypothetical protein
MNSVITVDTKELLSLASDLNNAADVLGKGASQAVNRVAAQARKDTVLQITSQLNLERGTVDTAVAVIQSATVSKPQAVLEIADEVHFLSSFNGAQKTQSNVWDAAKYIEKFGGLNAKRRLPNGKYGPWIPRKGDSLRAIRAGAKAAGISAQVSTRGGRKDFRHVFTQPVLSGKAMKGRWGSFYHPKGGGKAQAIYGPSEYQAAKGVWRDMEKELAEQLETEVMAETTNEIDRALKTK